ncbi:response regulator [Butyrivibrio sp. YAB3001]|uniref:response regulator n=1 Tax=Butyrivibrio sp. YAB3001 TaxID=1520812 RepID=UPI0008F6501E|nr:response regulator [Butyrivibrio sp. YAB3001]SFB84008.1 Response regulator receiver domain-containing protein [Butyrivibrio sp. YAB3001]
MQTIREWLKDSYQVAMVDSGMKAIKWLANNKVDLVLLDYEIPIINGPQIFEMLRNDTDTDNVPHRAAEQGQCNDCNEVKTCGLYIKEYGKGTA